jgi:hypothetical protein
MPYTIQPYDLEVDSSDLGKVLSVQEFQTIGVISNIQVFWAPPGLSYPLVTCGYFETPTGSVGTRVHLHGASTIRIETGERGFLKLSEAMKDYVSGIAGGITWDSEDNGKVVQSGKIILRLFGER